MNTCPSCGTGLLSADFQVIATLNGSTPTYGTADSDAFVAAYCDNDDCRVSLDGAGDGRLRRAELLQDGEPLDAPDEVTDAWIRAVTQLLPCEHPESVVTFSDDGTTTCTACGATAPGQNDLLELAT